MAAPLKGVSQPVLLQVRAGGLRADASTACNPAAAAVGASVGWLRMLALPAHPPSTHPPRQVLQLADRLQAAPSEHATVKALAAAAPLAWDTAIAVFSMPLSRVGQPAYKPLTSAAAAALQERLGDLDAV